MNYTRNKAAINEKKRVAHARHRAAIFTANRSRFDDILRQQEDISRLLYISSSVSGVKPSKLLGKKWV